MTIIDVIEKTIDNREISNDAHKRLLDNKEKLNQWIEYVCYDETSDNKKAKELKSKVYNFYSEHVNDLINKYEVYFHDFSTKISIMITDLVKMIAKASAAQTDKQQIEYLNDAYDIAYCLYYALCLEIIGYCIDRVEEYKKVLKTFNDKGVDCEKPNSSDKNAHENFAKKKKNERKELQNTLKILNDNFSTLFNKRSKLRTYKIEAIERSIAGVEKTDINTLWGKVESSMSYLKEVEKLFPVIINNGYNPSFMRKLLHFILFWGLPIFCAIMSIIIWCGR